MAFTAQSMLAKHPMLPVSRVTMENSVLKLKNAPGAQNGYLVKLCGVQNTGSQKGNISTTKTPNKKLLEGSQCPMDVWRARMQEGKA